MKYLVNTISQQTKVVEKGEELITYHVYVEKEFSTDKLRNFMVLVDDLKNSHERMLQAKVSILNSHDKVIEMFNITEELCSTK
jgi:hypothetical protein